jgi:hypothetical protein
MESAPALYLLVFAHRLAEDHTHFSTIIFQEVHTKILRFRSISFPAQNGQSASAVSRLQRLTHAILDQSGCNRKELTAGEN